MRHLLFAASWMGALAVAAPFANAQSVPGRDLLDLQLGTLAEAPGLAGDAAGGLYNPATLLGRSATRPRRSTRVALAHLSAPGDRGLDGQIASVSVVARRRWAAGFSGARVAVGEIVRTDTDPTSPMGTVLYDTYVASLAGAYRPLPHLALGVAVRYRFGRADTARVGAAGVDAGVIADGLLGRLDLRLAASSYLWRPNARYDDRPAGLAAADARVWGDTVTAEARLGVSVIASRGAGNEAFAYTSARYRAVEGRAGVAQLRAFGAPAQTQGRFALGLHYARISASVARQSGAAFGPLYQFTFSTALP